MKASDMAPGNLSCHRTIHQPTNRSLVFLCPRNLQHLQRRKNSFDSLEKMKIFILNLSLEQIYFLPGYVFKTQIENSKLEKNLGNLTSCKNDMEIT